MQNDLLRYKKGQKVCVADTETDGLNSLINLPWQISWVDCEISPNNNKILEDHDYYIDWGDEWADNLERFINEINKFKKILHFDKAKYHREKQSPEAVWAIFKKRLYDPETIIAGHNFLGFDIYMINHWRKKMGLPSDYSYLDRVIDTRALGLAMTQNVAASFLNDTERTSWQYKLIRMNKHNRRLKSNQTFLLKELDVEFDEDKLHEGLYDVKMCFENLKKLIWKVEI
tara:strand:- start:1362 stop:2048 length:687 start_codon:yes stop_codon:yes gene_type:complete